MCEKCNNVKFFWNISCLSWVTEKHQCHKKNILSCPNITTCTVQPSIYLNFDKVLLGMETGSPTDWAWMGRFIKMQLWEKVIFLESSDMCDKCNNVKFFSGILLIYPVVLYLKIIKSTKRIF